jgi:hypothetical protein
VEIDRSDRGEVYYLGRSLILVRMEHLQLPLSIHQIPLLFLGLDEQESLRPLLVNIPFKDFIFKVNVLGSLVFKMLFQDQ